MHGFATKKLAYRRAQDGIAIGRARVGRRSSPFQLKRPLLAAAVDNLAQVDGAAIAKLPGPIAKLVATIAGGVWIHPLQKVVARECLHKRVRRCILGREIEQICHLAGVGDELWVTCALWFDARVSGVLHMARVVSDIGIRG